MDIYVDTGDTLTRFKYLTKPHIKITKLSLQHVFS